MTHKLWIDIDTESCNNPKGMIDFESEVYVPEGKSVCFFLEDLLLEAGNDPENFFLYTEDAEGILSWKHGCEDDYSIAELNSLITKAEFLYPETPDSEVCILIHRELGSEDYWIAVLSMHDFKMHVSGDISGYFHDN